MTLAAPTIHRWSFDQYEKLGTDGLLGEQRVELIDGEILDMAPQQNPHAVAVSKVVRVLMENFPEPYFVKVQATHRLDDRSAPEPDVVLLVEYPSERKMTVSTPLLIAEVSDTTLAYDRSVKASLYAAHGVPEYWIINLLDRQLEVYRHPVAKSGTRFGWDYSQRENVRAGEIVSVAQFPSIKIPIGRMLP